MLEGLTFVDRVSGSCVSRRATARPLGALRQPRDDTLFSLAKNLIAWPTITMADSLP